MSSIRSSLYYNRLLLAMSPLGSVVVEVVEQKQPPAPTVPVSPRVPLYEAPEKASDLSKRADVESAEVTTADALNPKVSLCGHIFLTTVFMLLVAAYIAVSLSLYFNREEVVQYTQETSSRQMPIPLMLEISCTNAPNCGNATVTVNYTSIGGCGMHGPGVEVIQLPSVFADNRSVSVPVDLCLTPDEPFTTSTNGPIQVPGVVIDFTRINPGKIPGTKIPAPELLATAEVAVTYRQDSDYAGSGTRVMRRLISMSSWQVKTLIVGTTVNKREGEFESQQPAPVAVQYEGVRTNWRGTLILARPFFSTVVDRTMPGTLLQVLAGIGGATLLLASAFVILLPLWTRIFPAAKVVDSMPPSSPSWELQDIAAPTPSQ